MSFSVRAIAALLFLAPLAHGATFTVTSSGNAGPGTLRQAILDANATPGLDQIVFTVSSVNATNSMPQITDPVAIDGTVGSGRVTVNGVHFDCSSGFLFAAGSSGSSLTRVFVQNYCEAVRIQFGVTNVTVTASTLFHGVVINGHENVLGGTTAGSGNLIGGLRIAGDRNQVFRNSFQILPVRIFFADQNRIGSAGNGNEIGWLLLESSNGTIVEGNTFSLNGGAAIELRNFDPPATGATITGNTIRGHDIGILVSGSTGSGLAPYTGATITGNSISQVGIAIDLKGGGPTPNDPAPDADTGANNLQNFPVLTSAVLSPSQVVVNGTLTSAPLTTYLVELFGNPPTDPDATTLLASFDVTTDATGTATFSRTITSPLPAPDDVVTSTATNRLTGDTSEVSAPVAVDAPGQLGFAAPALTVNESDGSITIVVQRSGGSEGTVTVQFTTENGTATAPGDYQATSGTLTFGSGVTAQSIVIPITGDAIGEPAESFNVRLTAPTGGATLGAATTTVTIAAHAGPEPIPTLSEWSLLALALGLAVAMALRAR